jgi:vacuolar-type H+-ATPase subunit D/Vma8
MPTKRTIAQQRDDLQRRYQTVVDERDEAREQNTSDRFTAEQQFQAAVIRTDGTALCLECGHHIPNREATDA